MMNIPVPERHGNKTGQTRRISIGGTLKLQSTGCSDDESPCSHPTGAPAGAAPLLSSPARFHSSALQHHMQLGKTALLPGCHGACMQVPNPLRCQAIINPGMPLVQGRVEHSNEHSKGYKPVDICTTSDGGKPPITPTGNALVLQNNS